MLLIKNDILNNYTFKITKESRSGLTNLNNNFIF